ARTNLPVLCDVVAIGPVRVGTRADAGKSTAGVETSGGGIEGEVEPVPDVVVERGGRIAAGSVDADDRHVPIPAALYCRLSVPKQVVRGAQPRAEVWT